MDTEQQLVQKMGSWGTNEAWDSGWYRKTHCGVPKDGETVWYPRMHCCLPTWKR